MKKRKLLTSFLSIFRILVLDPCGWTPERTLQPLSPRLILRDGMGVLRR